jgi:hypothetical protein
MYVYPDKLRNIFHAGNVDGGISKHAQEVWKLVQFVLREDALLLLRVFLWLLNIA